MSIRILLGDVREKLAEMATESVHCVVTSPPYFGLRDYGTAAWEGGDPACDHSAVRRGHGDEKQSTSAGTSRDRIVGTDCRRCGAVRADKQIGLEPSPEAYVAVMVEVFREVRRVLRRDGTLWLNLGSSYASGDTRPSRSRGDAPAYDSDGTEPRDLMESDSAYRDPDDGLPSDSPTRHGRTVGKPSSSPQAAPLAAPTGRDSGQLDFSEASLGASLLSAPPSNTQSSSANGQAAGGPASEASAFPLSPLTCEPSAPLSADSSAYTSDISPKSPPSDGRMTGKVSSRSACGCGSCGVCWAYLAIPLLRLKPKDEINIPHLVALALQADGWWLRQTIIWAKPNPMPESVTDRCTKAHEYLFLLSKSARYHYDAEAIAETAEQSSGGWQTRARNGESTIRDGLKNPNRLNGGDGGECHGPGRAGDTRNRRSVWTVATQPFKEAHFATFPPDLIEPCILAGAPKDCCAKCGAPVVRVMETNNPSKQAADPDNTLGWSNTHSKTSNAQSSKSLHRNPGGVYSSAVFVGWQPSCACNAGTVPGTVLDPFGGAGTTGLVADRLQRDAILIELNPAYAAMAGERITDDGPLFAEVVA
jgi:DNA modification methylase